MLRILPSILVVGFLVGLGCRDEGPPAVASVLVTSPIGTRLGVGRSVRLAAQPRDSRDNPLPVAVTWRSSAPPVANVDTDGNVSGAAAGSATITAEAGGVSGTVTFQVIAADFAGISTLLADPYFSLLGSVLSGTVRQAVTNALNQCSTGISQGDFSTIEGCVAGVRGVAAAATDPTDRTLLAQMVLFLDHIERRLLP